MDSGNKLRQRIHIACEKMVPGPSADSVKQVPFGIVELLQAGFIDDAFEAFVQVPNRLI